MKKELICISCPRGCHITAENVSGDWQISGNSCPRGKVYAMQELTNPRRVVTAVIASDSAEMPYIPVRTDKPLPVKLIDGLLNQIYQMKISAPVRAGEVILQDIAGTGVRLIFSADCGK